MSKKFQPSFPKAYAKTEMAATRASSGDEMILRVNIADIRPNPKQPRRFFDESSLEDLAASIREKGILEPLVGRQEDDGTFTLIAGERRLRAAEKAELQSVPLIVKRVGDDELLLLALIENMQRNDLHPVDEARAVGDLVNQTGSQERAAVLLGLPRGTVSDRVRLLNLGDEVLDVCAAIPNVSRRGLLKLLDVPPRRRLAVARLLASETRSANAGAKSPAKASERRNAFEYKARTASNHEFRINVRFRKHGVDPREVIDALERYLETLRNEIADMSAISGNTVK